METGGKQSARGNMRKQRIHSCGDCRGYSEHQHRRQIARELREQFDDAHTPHGVGLTIRAGADKTKNKEVIV